jgi:hypothetical protein
MSEENAPVIADSLSDFALERWIEDDGRNYSVGVEQARGGWRACRERAILKLAAAEADLERLRALVREWLCERCNTVYPGPPQKGLKCVICPKCGGMTGPLQWVEQRKIEAELQQARKELAWLHSRPTDPELLAGLTYEDACHLGRALELGHRNVQYATPEWDQFERVKLFVEKIISTTNAMRFRALEAEAKQTARRPTRMAEIPCRVERFDRLGTGALVCSCGLAVTYTLTVSACEVFALEMLQRLHERHARFGAAQAAVKEMLEALESVGRVTGNTFCWCPAQAWDCEDSDCIAARAAIRVGEKVLEGR